MIYPPQAESRRRRDVGQPRLAGFRRREDDSADADADAEAAAVERRRLQRVAVVSLHTAEGSCFITACTDRKIQHIWRPSASPVLLLSLCTTDGACRGINASSQPTDGMN